MPSDAQGPMQQLQLTRFCCKSAAHFGVRQLAVWSNAIVLVGWRAPDHPVQVEYLAQSPQVGCSTMMNGIQDLDVRQHCCKSTLENDSGSAAAGATTNWCFDRNCRWRSRSAADSGTQPRSRSAGAVLQAPAKYHSKHSKCSRRASARGHTASWPCSRWHKYSPTAWNKHQPSPGTRMTGAPKRANCCCIWSQLPSPLLARPLWRDRPAVLRPTWPPTNQYSFLQCCVLHEFRPI